VRFYETKQYKKAVKAADQVSVQCEAPGQSCSAAGSMLTVPGS
jgi:hypothetical protein